MNFLPFRIGTGHLKQKSHINILLLTVIYHLLQDSQIESQPKITLFSGDEDSTSADDTESSLREESSEPIQSPPAEIPNTTPKNQSQPRRICESGALKRKAETFSNVNVFNNALDRLDKISNSASLPVDDEFDLFGKQIACQLKQLPLHKALHIQQQF